MVQDKPLRTSWQRKMKERQERKLARDFARHLEEEKERRRQVRAEPVSTGRGYRGLARGWGLDLRGRPGAEGSTVWGHRAGKPGGCPV